MSFLPFGWNSFQWPSAIANDLMIYPYIHRGTCEREEKGRIIPGILHTIKKKGARDTFSAGIRERPSTPCPIIPHNLNIFEFSLCLHHVVSHGLQYAPYRMQANWKTNTKLYTKHQFPISCSVCLAFRCFSGGGGHFVLCIFSSSVVCACCFCLQVQERNIYQHHDAGKEQKKTTKQRAAAAVAPTASGGFLFISINCWFFNHQYC